MAGNDIVDLDQAKKESNWRRKGYLEKIFTADEQFLISTAEDPEIMVWLLWSMKEAVYKLHTRGTKIRTFAPTSISCNNLIVHEKVATGSVAYQQQVYFTCSSITEQYIHTIAAQDKVLLKQVQAQIGPYDPLNSGYKATNPISVSHHGHYLALIY